MGIFDQAKDALGDNPEAVDSGVDKAADFADERSGGQYSEQIDQGAETVKDQAGEFLGGGAEGEQAEAPQEGQDSQQEGQEPQ